MGRVGRVHISYRAKSVARGSAIRCVTCLPPKRSEGFSISERLQMMLSCLVAFAKCKLVGSLQEKVSETLWPEVGTITVN